MSKDYLKKARKIVDSKMTGELVSTLARLLCRIDELDVSTLARLLCRIDELEKCQEVHTYLCTECGKPRTKDEGGTTFTVCDECWEKAYVKLREDLRKAAASQGSSIVSFLIGHMAKVKELEDWRDVVEKEVGEVYCYITNNKLSKPTYLASVMIAEVDDMVSRIVDERVKELEAENARYKEALTKLSKLGNEPYLGNSDGNIIAQEALGKEVEE